MQEDKEKKLQELINKSETSAKRTTIILEKDEREYIDSLIREGKEPGIKPLISKMLDVYRSMMIYDWRFPGEYYCGISRTHWSDHVPTSSGIHGNDGYRAAKVHLHANW